MFANTNLVCADVHVKLNSGKIFVAFYVGIGLLNARRRFCHRSSRKNGPPSKSGQHANGKNRFHAVGC